ESDSCAVEKQQEESMRGSDLRTGELFSYVDLEQRVPESHPLRLIRCIVNQVLAALDGEFGKLYAAEGRPSIAPERLLRALLLQAFYSIRSERQLMEQLHYNLLYRWFVGLGVDDRVWVATVFTKNRDRLLEAEVARKFLAELLAHRQVRALLSDDHFSVDGTQVQAWASMKSFVAKDGSGDPPSPGRNGERHFHGEQRSNETHSSTTDPEAKLAKKGKGKEAKLAYTGNVMTENRNGFVVEAELRQVSGMVERETAKDMIVRYSPGAKRITVGADKGFDTADFVSDMRDFNVTPHVAQNTTNRLSAIDGRTIRHCGYEVSQQKRIVAAIAGIGDTAIEDVADERLHLRNDRGERVPVIRIARQCCSMGDKLPAGGMLHRGGDAHFDTEFVRPVRFALADALDLWGVQGIDLAAALAALLLLHAPGQEQGRYERFPQIFIPDDAPLDVADDTAEIGLELA